MRGKTRVVLSALASLILVPAVWATPTPRGAATRDASNARTAAQTQSVSGTIASVQTDSFTLTVGAGVTSGKQLLPENASPKTMNFLIDKNTAVDGKLQVGAHADVTYREDNGSNLAVSVRVTR
jgi:hypothetical protein